MQNKPSYRRPAIYITLPSGGQWWTPNSVEFEGNGTEIGVMPMTVRDEMILRTPDALMNGEAVVSTIKSCCPAIKDPWACPNIDLDTILIGIRIATYGADMEVNAQIPKVNQMHKFSVDLNQAMDLIDKTPFAPVHHLSDSTMIECKPLTYKMVTDINLKNYESARLADSISKSKNTETVKIQEIQKAFMNVTNMTVKSIADQIAKVKTEEFELTSPTDIQNWVSDIPAQLANEVKQQLQDQRTIGTLKPVTIHTPEEFIQQGAPATFTQTLNMDFANFFASKS